MNEINLDEELLDLRIKKSPSTKLSQKRISYDSPSSSNSSKKSSDEDKDVWLEDCQVYTSIDTMAQDNMTKLVEEMKTKEKLKHKNQAEIVWGETKNMEDGNDSDQSVMMPDKSGMIGLSILSLSYSYVMKFVRNL
jgi:membrane peptidoglycan carboxypeptidase